MRMSGWVKRRIRRELMSKEDRESWRALNEWIWGDHNASNKTASSQKYQQNYHDYDKHPSSSSMAKVLLGIIIGLLLVGLIYMLIWTAQQGI